MDRHAPLRRPPYRTEDVEGVWDSPGLHAHLLILADKARRFASDPDIAEARAVALSERLGGRDDAGRRHPRGSGGSGGRGARLVGARYGHGALDQLVDRAPARGPLRPAPVRPCPSSAGSTRGPVHQGPAPRPSTGTWSARAAVPPADHPARSKQDPASSWSLALPPSWPGPSRAGTLRCDERRRPAARMVVLGGTVRCASGQALERHRVLPRR